MTISLFQAMGHLESVLTQHLAGLAANESAAVLQDLKRRPDLSTLASLESLATPEQLVGLLFHQDRYDAVARRLDFPPDTLRTIFSAETRADRLLPATTGLNLWLHRISLKHLEASFATTVAMTMDDWKNSNVRRITPRGRESIQTWVTNRTTLLGSTRLVIESSAEIQEDHRKVEWFGAQFRIKIVDWDGAYLTQANTATFLQRNLPGMEFARLRPFESRFDGLIPGTNHGWQALLVMRNLALIFHSPIFPRRRSEGLAPFFSDARKMALQVLRGLLAQSE